MKSYGKLVPLIACLFMLFMKVSAFHVYAHQDSEDTSIENCGICELAIESQQTALDLTSDVAVVLNIDYTRFRIPKVFYCSEFVETSTIFKLFSRPPPHLA